MEWSIAGISLLGRRFEMTEEEMEKEFEEWFPKLQRCFTPDIHLVMKVGAKQAYLQACRKRQEEIEKLKEEIRELKGEYIYGRTYDFLI
jgi:hypothetical protein